jgi:hypothetical protein
VYRNGAAGAERRSVIADEVDIADAIELLVVGHSGLTIAEADLRPQIEIDLDPAIGRLALIRPALSPLVDRERPSGVGPDRLIAMCVRRRRCRKEECIAANPRGEEKTGDGCDPLDHNRSSNRSCVMPAPGAGIHVFPSSIAENKDVDGRDKPGHDGRDPSSPR